MLAAAKRVPHPTKPGVTISASRATQLRYIAEGLCAMCGRVREHYAVYCDTCEARHVEAARRRRGGTPWQPGRPGRKPYVLPNKVKR